MWTFVSSFEVSLLISISKLVFAPAPIPVILHLTCPLVREPHFGYALTRRFKLGLGILQELAGGTTAPLRALV